MTERVHSSWRQGIVPDPQDAVAKALRHTRFDLFYGPHYLRFTRTPGPEGSLRLRLEERARLIRRDGEQPELRTGDQIASPFAFEVVLAGRSPDAGPPSSGPTGRRQNDAGRCFFERAARLLDERES